MNKKFFDILKSVVVTKAYASRTFSSDPLQAFKFRVQLSCISGELGFKSVGGLSREIEVVEYLENTIDHTHKLPGRETVGEVTRERGMYSDATLINAYTNIFKSGSAKRFDATISVCDRFGAVKRSFKLAECWFSGYELADLDAESSDVLIETLTMQYEYFL